MDIPPGDGGTPPCGPCGNPPALAICATAGGRTLAVADIRNSFAANCSTSAAAFGSLSRSMTDIACKPCRTILTSMASRLLACTKPPPKRSAIGDDNRLFRSGLGGPEFSSGLLKFGLGICPIGTLILLPYNLYSIKCQCYPYSSIIMIPAVPLPPNALLVTNAATAPPPPPPYPVAA